MSNSENTFRALQDLPPFVDRWQCRFGWHRWGKWSDPIKKGGDVYFRQHRTCVDCGRVSISKVEAPI